MIDAAGYLRNRLERCSKYDLSDDERGELGLSEFLFKQIVSKKFRKWSIDDDTQQRIRKAIDLNVHANAPLKFTFPFGGYKLWRLQTAPEVDWAEFFTIAYYLTYLAPIAAAYTPGVLLSFCSDDIIIERMNNIPDANQESYASSFNILLDAFRMYFPTNVTVELRRVRDFYPDRRVYESELAANIEQFEKEFASLDPALLAEKEKSSALNIRWDGLRDLTGLSDAEKHEMIRHATVLHDATCFVSKRKEFVRGEDKVVIFSNKIRNCVPLGTTKSSRTKFWTGFGVLERRGDDFYDLVLSPDQYMKIKDIEHEIVPIDFIPLKNFSEISIYVQRFDFDRPT